MTLDQRLSDAARHIADGLVPPAVDLDRVRAQARSNRRRAASLAVAAVVTTVVGVTTLVDGRATSAPPPIPATTPTPTQTSNRAWSPASMTPEVVVHTPAALLQSVGVAPGNTDVRMSIWAVAGYRGMALTTDGFRTTTYASAPPEEANQVVSSPKDGVFLLSDGSDHEWLVDVRGTVRRVKRVVDSSFAPADSRLWFQCVYGSWRSRWCALDLRTATAHVSSKKWDGSAVRPGLGAQPWGAHPEPRAASTTGRLEAWWYTDRGRQVHTVAAAHDGDYILGTPPGEMAFWAPGPRSGTLDIHTSRNGGSDWKAETRTGPGIGGHARVTRSPDGALLTYTIGEKLVVLRAEAGGGPFRKVVETESFGGEPAAGIGIQGGLVYLNAGDVAVVSRDGGRTWTTIRTWR
jgi:hypothetical protein